MITNTELDLREQLTDAAAKLDRLSRIIGDADADTLSRIAPELHRCERAIRLAARQRSGVPGPAETEAYRAWKRAASRFRDAAHQRLEELDDRIHSLRQCNRALRAYGGLTAHHRGQRVRRKF